MPMKLLGKLLFFLGIATAAMAQWPLPTFEPRNSSIQTTGSTAYLKFTYSWSCPQELGKTDPILNGTNIQQNIFLSENFSVFCPDVFPPPVFTSQATIVVSRK